MVARARERASERAGRPTIYAPRLIWQHCLRARKQFVPNTRLLFCDIIADSARPRSQGGPFLRRIFLSHRAIRNSPGRDRGSLSPTPFASILALRATAFCFSPSPSISTCLFLPALYRDILLLQLTSSVHGSLSFYGSSTRGRVHPIFSTFLFSPLALSLSLSLSFSLSFSKEIFLPLSLGRFDRPNLLR